MDISAVKNKGNFFSILHGDVTGTQQERESEFRVKQVQGCSISKQVRVGKTIVRNSETRLRIRKPEYHTLHSVVLGKNRLIHSTKHCFAK